MKLLSIEEAVTHGLKQEKKTIWDDFSEVSYRRWMCNKCGEIILEQSILTLIYHSCKTAE